MDTDTMPPPTSDMIEILARLYKHLGAERMEQLPDLLDEVASKTGYGAVKIILVDGRVVRLKDEKSY